MAEKNSEGTYELKTVTLLHFWQVFFFLYKAIILLNLKYKEKLT